MMMMMMMMMMVLIASTDSESGIGNLANLRLWQWTTKRRFRPNEEQRL